MKRPRLLDLFCGGGGAAMGYHRAGFDVVGVDIVPQYDYPFPFVLGNALHTRLAVVQTFAELGVPWVVENVPGAPMPDDAVTYCGSSFGLLVRRHRLFASNVELVPPPCDHASQPFVLGVYGHGGGTMFRADRARRGGTQVTGKLAADVLGVDWTHRQAVLSQMIPPAYTEHIGRQILAALDAAA